MWVVKGHYYFAGLSFYNFPYLFGLLFGLGLYSRYQADPERFKDRYDCLLSSTGLASAGGVPERRLSGGADPAADAAKVST